MRYHYREFKDKIVVDGGIIDKEMWKQYPHGKEYISYQELAKALKRRDHVPLVTDAAHDHTGPVVDGRAIIGAVRLTPYPRKRALNGEYTFYKDHTPQWVLDAIRGGRPVPLSPFKFINVRDHKQEDILYDHVAILSETSPRCSVSQGCGVGVYDSMSPEEKEKLEEMKDDEKVPIEPKGQGLSAPLSSIEPEKDKADVAPEAPSEVTEPDAVQDVEALQTQIHDLQATLKAKEAELTSEREPLIGLLLQRGISREAAEAMSLKDLRTTAGALQTQQTQGLPGTVPAPYEEPKTYAERKAEAAEKFQKDLSEQSKKEFENW